MNDCPSTERLQSLLAEGLPAPERSDLETHIESCPDCQQSLEKLTADPKLRSLAPPEASAESPLLKLHDLSPGRAGGRPGDVLATVSLSAPQTEEAPALNFLAPPQRPDSLGRLGHHEILEVLGRGGFGIVLRAFDDNLQRVVAIKVLAPELAATSPARKRFLREARSAAQVRHEGVVHIHAIEEQPLPYLVMEYVPGETLQQRLDRIGPLDAAEVVSIGRQMADALGAAHAAGLIHRDVKPANVLLEAGPRLKAKVTDFGLARAADDASITQSGVVAGTPMYMSPEQARGEKLDHRTDLFSLGSVLYAITAGRPPFRAENTLAVLKRVAEDEPRSIPEIIPETPQWLCQVIARLMAKDPADRFQSAAEVVAALESGKAPATLPKRRPVRSRRLPMLVGGVLALAVLMGIGIYALTRPKAGPFPDAGGMGKAVGPSTADESFVYPGMRGITLSPKGDVLAAAVSYGTNDQAPGWVLFWDVATGEPLGPPLLAASSYVVQLAFSSNGERVAVGAIDGTVSIWDVKSRSKLRSHALEQHPAALEFSPDGKWLLVAWTATEQGPHHGWVRLFHAETLGGVRSFAVTTPREGVANLHAATFSADGKQFAVGAMNGEVRFWDPDTGNETDTPRVVPDGAWALRFDPESKSLVAGNKHGAVFRWKDGNLQLMNEATRDNIVLCLAFSRNGKWLAWGTLDGRVYARNQETGQVRLALTCKGDVRNVTFTPDGKRLIAAGQNDARPPRIWDTETGTEKEGFQLPKGARLP